jgi:hypothetical protein
VGAPLWTARASAFSGASAYTNDVAWSTPAAIFVAVGYAPGESLAYSTDGINWTALDLFDSGTGGQGGTVAWSDDIGLFVAGGYNSSGANLWTSPDGIVWTNQSTPGEFGAGGQIFASYYDPVSGFFYVGGLPVSPGQDLMMKSNNGTVWTIVSSAYFSPATLLGIGGDPAGNLIAAGTSSTGFTFLQTSPDGLAWTDQPGVPFGGGVYEPLWSVNFSKMLIAVAGATGVLWSSVDLGVTWTQEPTIMDDPGGGAFGIGIVESGANLSVFGRSADNTKTIISTLDLVGWVNSGTSLYSGSGVSYGGAYSPSLDLLVSVGYTGAAASLASASGAFTPVPPSRRFFQGYPWRFLFADTPSNVSSGGVTTTWAEKLLTSREIALGLNQPTSISAAVWPDDRRVNAIFTDGDPLVAQSNRIVYCFRREGGSPPWVIRAAGILMSPQDQGDADVPLTHFTAYDPRMFLAARPARIFAGAETGSIPDADGWLTFQPGPTLSRGDQIVCGVLAQTIAQDGFAFIDAGVAWGGTAFYTGTIEMTDLIWFQIQRGQTVADVWDALCSSNLDIVLTPIYDPINRPGYTHELNVYRLAGQEQPTSVFAWDMMNRSLTNVDRMHDGTPGNFINTIQAYAGPGGFPVPAAGPLTNALSVDKYLAYWLNTFDVAGGAVDPTGSVVLSMARQQLELAKQGKRTMTVAPTSGRAPIPLTEYGIGDRIPILTTNRLRVRSSASFGTPVRAQRVQGIPIQITDDGVEQVSALLCSPDWDPRT